MQTRSAAVTMWESSRPGTEKQPHRLTGLIAALHGLASVGRYLSIYLPPTEERLRANCFVQKQRGKVLDYYTVPPIPDLSKLVHARHVRRLASAPWPGSPCKFQRPARNPNKDGFALKLEAIRTGPPIVTEWIPSQQPSNNSIRCIGLMPGPS
ncbi:hypothetical protein VTN96DRAFT_7785 [Rasamsonia emersonii]